jgi:hypothetical protein
MPKKYTWDRERRRYRDDAGALVPESTVRRWVDEFAASLAVLFAARAARVREAHAGGTLTMEILQAWYSVTRLDIRSAHRAATVVAYGGEDEMTDEEWHRADSRVRDEQGFWDTFAAGVFVGSVQMDGRIESRTALYGQAVYSTYENSVRQREQRAGAEQERRILTSGNSCATCQDQAGLGWSPIGSLNALGDSECRSNCRCFFEYRTAPPGES